MDFLSVGCGFIPVSQNIPAKLLAGCWRRTVSVSYCSRPPSSTPRPDKQAFADLKRRGIVLSLHPQRRDGRPENRWIWIRDLPRRGGCRAGFPTGAVREIREIRGKNPVGRGHALFDVKMRPNRVYAWPEALSK
jgi:hypothetical protein